MPEAMNEINEKLDRIIAYLHFSSLKQLQEIVPKILDKDDKKLVYNACDGKTGINEIARRTEIQAMNVSNYIKRFEQQGIIISKVTGNKKLPLKIVDLEALNMQVPAKKSKGGDEGGPEF